MFVFIDEIKRNYTRYTFHDLGIFECFYPMSDMRVDNFNCINKQQSLFYHSVFFDEVRRCCIIT
jgi:hypothetical protein